MANMVKSQTLERFAFFCLSHILQFVRIQKTIILSILKVILQYILINP